MSRIGKLPIPYPKGVEPVVNDGVITVKGPRGTLTRRIRPEISVRVVPDEQRIYVERPSDARLHRSLHGLTRTLIANMVTGVSEGYTRVLQVIGVGYKAQVDGNRLVLQPGTSHQIFIEAPEGVSFEVQMDTNTRMPMITVHGLDKQVFGQVCADIRAVRPPYAYAYSSLSNVPSGYAKGIWYRGERLRLKAGKQAVKK
jgi:large subunit ribosomal protein L6